MSTSVVEPKPLTFTDLPAAGSGDAGPAPRGGTAPAPPFEGDDQVAKPVQKRPDKSKDKPDELGDLRKRLEASEQRIRELADSERYWAEQARGRGTADLEPDEEPPAPEPEEEDESADDFLDRLSKEGPRAVAKVAAKLASKEGFVRKEDVSKIVAPLIQEVVQRERGKLTADAKLVTQYPELRDEKSELFKATAVIYRELVAEDPDLKGSPQTLFMAARAARAELKAAAKTAANGDQQPDGESGDYREEREDREEARQRRIRAQQGDTGRGRSTPYEGDDDPLGPAQRDVLDLFARVGLDEQSYRAERARMRRR
jgi:hypothetical protein